MKKWIPLLPLLVLSVACNEFGAQSGSEFMAPQSNTSRASAEPEVMMAPTPAAEENESNSVIDTNATTTVIDTNATTTVIDTNATTTVIDTNATTTVIDTNATTTIVDTNATTTVIDTNATTTVVDTNATTTVIDTNATTTVVNTTAVVSTCNMLNDANLEVILPGYGLMATAYDGSKMKGNSATFPDMQAHGIKMDELMFMKDLNYSYVKNDGFRKPAGGMMMNSEEVPMVENYALEIKSNLVLDEGEEDGLYQISAILNDGLVLVAGDDIIIDLDKNAPKDGGRYSGFSDKQPLVRMEKGKPVSLQLKYYQGETPSLALIVMWRKVKNLDGSLVAGAIIKDLNEQKRSGNPVFFDLARGPQPDKDYMDLFSAADRKIPWKILKHKNYKHNLDVDTSVCANN